MTDFFYINHGFQSFNFCFYSTDVDERIWAKKQKIFAAIICHNDELFTKVLFTHHCT